MSNNANQPAAVSSGTIPTELAPGLSNLGCGYNIFGQYASAASIKMQLFDWHKKTDYTQVDYQNYFRPSIVDVLTEPDTSTYYSRGLTISKYQSNLSGHFDLSLGFDLFSGSLKSDFSSEHLHESKYAYCRVQRSVSYAQLSFNASSNSMRQWLFDHVANMLENAQSTDELNAVFDTLGSHYLNNINVGGRAVQSSSTHMQHITSSSQYGTQANMAFEASIGLGISDKKSIDKFSQNSNIQSIALGGDPALFPTGFFSEGDKVNQSQYLEQYNLWVKSIESNPVFIDFIAQDSLSPIWHLCESPEQSVKLKQHFIKVWGPKQQYLASLKQPYLNDFAVNPYNLTTPPCGFTQVTNPSQEPDGSPGKSNIPVGDSGHIPCVKMVTPNAIDPNDNPICVTDIQLVERHNVPPDYTMLSGLLYNVYGKHYHLAIKQVPYSPKEAIRDVIIIGKDSPPPKGYTKIAGSLSSPGEAEINLYYLQNR